MIAASGFADFGLFCLGRNLPAAEIQSLARRFAAIGSVIISQAARETAKARLREALAEHHTRHPQILGPRREQALSMMGKSLAGGVAKVCLAEALAEGRVVADGACIRLPSHQAHLGAQDACLWGGIQAALQDAGLRPPHVGALAEASDLSFREMLGSLLRFEQFGLLTRVARNRFFLPQTIDVLRDMALQLAQAAEGDGFTAAAFNEMSAIGRNLSIEILEYFDRTGVTRRAGPRRYLL